MLKNDDLYKMRISAHYRGATTCDHCGTSIKNIVEVRGNGKTGNIGQQCAEKLGFDKYQIRQKLTHDQMKQRKAERKEREDAKDAKLERERVAIDDELSKRMASPVGEIVLQLEKVTFNCDQYLCRDDYGRELFLENDFRYSLAKQLRIRPLSARQADFVSKFIAGGQSQRRNKANSDEWDRIWEVCVSDDYNGITYNFLNSIK